MSLAHMVVENQQLDLQNVVESRFEPMEESDVIHKLKDGSYVYEENLLDWDDVTGKTKMFKMFYLSNLANFSSFQTTAQKWSDNDYDEETELYYDELAEMEDWK